jgi:sugar lactone lactonase YvrE
MEAPVLPPTADPREEEPAPTRPAAQIPLPAIPDVSGTVQAELATVQAALPTGIAIPLPGQQPGPAFGEVVLAFGEEGTGDGFLSDPREIAVGPDGAIYVADYTTRRVQRFGPEGRFERSWLVEDERPIMALAADRQGRVYVSQVAGVTVYDGASGAIVDVIARGEGFSELIALGDGSLLGVPWAGDELVRLGPDGSELGRLSNPLAAADSGDSPVAIAADGLGTLYIMGSRGGEVFVFSPEGAFRDKFPAPGATFFPQLAVDGQGRVFVSTFMGGIQVYAPDGRPLGAIATPGYAFDLTFDGESSLYAATNAPAVIKVRGGPR